MEIFLQLFLCFEASIAYDLLFFSDISFYTRKVGSHNCSCCHYCFLLKFYYDQQWKIYRIVWKREVL